MVKATLSLFAIFLLVSSSAAQTAQRSASLKSLVEAERAFAKTSTEIGARPSFMRYFADSALVFRPHPVRYKEAMKNVPMPKNPLETSLVWEPIWADVAQSGDFGYTTGPSVWTDHTPAHRPTYYGFYFSFWKKQPTGEWKVVFDVGTELPGPYPGSRELRSPETHVAGKKTAAAQHSGPMEAERAFHAAVLNKGLQSVSGELMEPAVRIYRQGVQPIVGLDSARTYFSGHPYLSTWEPIGADVAASGDLGYTYGSYGIRNAAEGEKGYFLHAWKRSASGQWKLAAEVLSPLPQEKK